MKAIIDELGFYAAKQKWPKGLEGMPDLLKRAQAALLADGGPMTITYETRAVILDVSRPLQEPDQIPAGWDRKPESFFNYPWNVELEADGWHLRDLRRLGLYREISTHPTALEAMQAASSEDKPCE